MRIRNKIPKIKRTVKEYEYFIILALLGIPIGVAVGAADSVFGHGLVFVNKLRDAHPYWFIPFLAFVGLFIIWVRRRITKNDKFGINLVFAVGLGDATRIPLRLVPYVIVSTWLTHLFGGSSGREGVALQIGATISNRFGRKLPIKNVTEVFLITGLAAGFSGLFLTPITAILFAIEVLIAGAIEYKALLPALTASFSAAVTSGLLGLGKMSYSLNIQLPFNVINTIKIIVLGIIFGLVGGLFVYILRRVKMYLEKYMPNPYIRIFVVGIILSLVMILFHGRYCGVGSNLIEGVFNKDVIYSYDFILKLLLTVLTLSIGFQGGEIMPLFAIGATLGYVIAPYFGFDPLFVGALGMCSVFGSATNTFFAPIFVGAEIFGFAALPYFFAVCAISYFCNLNKSVYSLQKINKND